MSAGQPIGDREREILTAIVETFISTGEPVGSRMISRASREGLSPATIRNVMADLADAGFLEQPHTSAGRVPSSSAYRYYVQQLSGEARLSQADEGMIQDSLQGVTDVQEFMERTSHVLSLISRNVGVDGCGQRDPRMRSSMCTFRGLAIRRCWRLWSPGREWYAIGSCVLTCRRRTSTSAARFINENFHGWTLEAVRAEIARRLVQERSEYDRLMTSVEQLYKQGVLSAEDSAQVVFVEGAANLVAGEQDRVRLQELLHALDEKQKLVELLGAYLDARQEAVRVVIGLDEASPSMRNLVLIGTPARVGGEVMGSLAVLGPPRMDYQHTITAVSYIARLFDKVLNESE